MMTTKWIVLLLLALKVTVTAYSSTPDQTQGDPFTTASGEKVKPGIVAISRDLKKHLPWGSKIHLEGIGTFIVQDTMHRRWRQRVDIWMENRKAAKRFGKKQTIMRRVK